MTVFGLDGTNVATPVPLVGFPYRFLPEVKTIWLPSGDQTGNASRLGSDVKRVASPRANHLGRNRKEVRAIVPRDAVLSNQAYVRLMNQR